VSIKVSKMKENILHKGVISLDMNHVRCYDILCKGGKKESLREERKEVKK